MGRMGSNSVGKETGARQCVTQRRSCSEGALGEQVSAGACAQLDVNVGSRTGSICLTAAGAQVPFV